MARPRCRPGLRGAPRAATLLALWLTVLGAAPPQTWRATAVAAFDEAWQTIHDTFYDPTFGGIDWAAVRAELRPRVAAATSPEAARDVIREMLARLRHSHFSLLGPPREDAPAGDAIVPIEIRSFEDGLLVTSVADDSSAYAAGVRPGQRLLAIDDRLVSELTADARNQAEGRAARLALWRLASSALRGRAGSTVHLRLRSPDGREQTVEVTRVREPGTPVALGNLPPLAAQTRAQALRTPAGLEAALIAFNIWMPAVAEPFAMAIDEHRNADGLVIDLRGNPGGLADMIRGLAGHLLDRPLLIGRMTMRDLELEFRANPRRSTADGRRVTPYAGPVAILVDELTGSASECFAGGLQSLGRARVFGVTTMGQALPAATRQLANGDVLLYAIGDFVTATGQRLERTGVVPDELVPLDPVALAAGRDGPLEAALRWIDQSGGAAGGQADDERGAAARFARARDAATVSLHR
jgi:carboxyl-terminal processing protease